MVFTSFDQLIEENRKKQDQKTVAVVCAEDAHTLQAVMTAGKDGVAKPLLIGDETKIRELVKEYEGYCDYSIIPAGDNAEALKKTLEMVRSGQADAIMKGRIETAELMRMVVSQESGLRTGELMSHMLVVKIPNYHKLICMSDVALVTYPDVEQKKQIILNTVGVLKGIGFSDIKVAVLAAVDKVNPKMPESVDAAELKRMNQAGEIPDCIVEGPISYDLAIDPESSRIKGYQSPVAGDADMLLCPNITAGNILVKSLVFSGNAIAGGIVIGAKVPVILTSRASSTDEKYRSVVLAASVNT